jgi:carbamate kinase
LTDSRHTAARRPRPEKIVVAIGGNALAHSGEAPTLATQFRNAERAMNALAPLIEAGNRLVITHGNGFQVGNILIRVEESLGKAYPIPLEVCVAESQGEIGYMIEQTLQNVLRRRRLEMPVVSLLTQVVVNPRDPAFRKPTKPVGPLLTREHARQLEEAGCEVVEVKGRGWRRVVASPHPVDIDEPQVVEWLLRRGAVVIAAGGGGVPVVRGRNGSLRGVPAVIDKDLASATLARAIGARRLVILTGEPCAYLDYGEESQRAIRSMTAREAREHLGAGQFPEGSMGPKVEAAALFVEHGGRAAVITRADDLRRALAGEAGTTVTPNGRGSAARSRG